MFLSADSERLQIRDQDQLSSFPGALSECQIPSVLFKKKNTFSNSIIGSFLNSFLEEKILSSSEVEDTFITVINSVLTKCFIVCLLQKIETGGF